MEIRSRFNETVSFCSDDKDMRLTLEAAVRSRADLSGADLSRADLSGANLSRADLSRANLSRAKIGDLMCVNELEDAVDLAPMIFDFWEQNEIDKTQQKFSMYRIPGETRALVLMCPGLTGGYCYVVGRREIWWWQWFCPNPKTVPVLWRDK